MDDAITGGSSSEFLLKEPADQAQERTEERDNVFKAYPILEGVIDRLKQRINFYKSTDSIDTSVLTDPEMFMHTVAGNKLAAENLQIELTYLEELIKTHLMPNIG